MDLAAKVTETEHIEPRLVAGDNVPHFKYTYAFVPISWERTLGFGLELPKHLELRVTNHRNHRLGRYAQDLGPADLGPNGPLGLYTTVGVRWYFGGYRGR